MNQEKILYSDIERLISQGPEGVESAFVRLLNKSPENQDPKETYMEFGQMLKDQNGSNRRFHMFSFLLGYFTQQAGAYCSTKKEQESLFKQALSHYQSFQHKNKSQNADINYFAQWQIGVLQHSLGYPWSVAEESYLQAMEYDKTRAETLREIIVYQCSQKNWPVALIYSAYARDNLLGKPPATGKWFINTSFYKWKILKYHIHILLNLNKSDQARESARELFGCDLQSVDISASEKEEIEGLKQSWEELL